MIPGTSSIYACTCHTCDYELEVFDRRTAKRARNYHKYTNPTHRVGVERVAGGVPAADLEDLQAVYDGKDREFEENYRWWMWFWQFR